MSEANPILEIPPTSSKPLSERAQELLPSCVILVVVAEFAHRAIAGQWDVTSGVLASIIAVLVLAAIWPWAATHLLRSQPTPKAVWTNGKNAAMYFSANDEAFVVHGNLGYRLRFSNGKRQYYFCVSHHGEVGTFEMTRTPDNMIKLDFNPSGKPSFSLKFYPAR